MRYVRSALALLYVLSVYSSSASAATAQAPASALDAGASGVSISVANAVTTGQSSGGAKLRISITNSSNRILVHTFPDNQGSVQVEVRGADGIVPQETNVGCKLHMSKKCGPAVKLFGPVSFTATIVMPGQTISFERDLAKEFDLVDSRSLVVTVLASDFVLVDAPKNISEAPEEQRRGYLLDYQRYPYTKLSRFRSNAIRIEIKH